MRAEGELDFAPLDSSSDSFSLGLVVAVSVAWWVSLMADAFKKTRDCCLWFEDEDITDAVQDHSPTLRLTRR